MGFSFGLRLLDFFFTFRFGLGWFGVFRVTHLIKKIFLVNIIFDRGLKLFYFIIDNPLIHHSDDLPFLKFNHRLHSTGIVNVFLFSIKSYLSRLHQKVIVIPVHFKYSAPFFIVIFSYYHEGKF